MRVGDVPSLEVMVVANYMTKPPGAIFPTVGETVEHRGITAGKEGGCKA